jgi:cell division protein FtsB
MIQKIKKIINNQDIFNSKNLAVIVFLIISLSVTWSTAKIIQKNYYLQQQINELEQEVAVQQQINQNQKIKNKYFETDSYLEIAARRYFQKSLPGEKLYIVPKDVALSKIKPVETPQEKQESLSDRSFIIKNWQSWINFVLNKQNN